MPLRSRVGVSVSMRMPNFLIIGAAKSGTTSLYRYVKQHPQIYMSSVKEPQFFSSEGKDLDFRGPGDREIVERTWITTLKEYSELFSGVRDEIAVGEASNMYLYDATAATRIRDYVPDVKLIAILRDPADRAYSQFSFMTLNGREQLAEFADAFQAEEARICDDWMPSWHYKRTGFYYAQLRRYFDVFPSIQIKVYLFEDFIADPRYVLQDLFQFLGVDVTFNPDVREQHNPSGLPRSRAVHSFLTSRSPIKRALRAVVPSGMRRRTVRRMRNRNLVKRQLSPKVRSQLVDAYRDDILNLQVLIGRDLSRWLD